MQKRCLTCNALIDVNAKFCQKCGSNNFSQPVQQPVQQPNTIGYEGGQAFNNVPPVQPPMNFAPPEPPKKKKGMAPWQIILIVLVSVAVAILVYFFVTDLADKNSASSDEKEETKVTEITQQSVEPGTNNNNPDNPPLTFDVPYTKGEVVGNNYVNEWANISFSIKNLPEADQTVYSTYTNATTECGYISVNQNTGSSVMVMFEDLSGQTQVETAAEYIESLKKVVTVMYGDGIELNSYNPNATIAGEVYLTLGLKHQTTGLELRYFVRVLDDRAIVFLASGFNESTINSFTSSIKQYNSL